MANTTAWGIDVGNRALKAVKLVSTAEGVRIDDLVVVEHEHLLSNAGDNKESFIQNALANFAQNNQTKGAPVAVGVSGQSTFSRFVPLPPVEKKKIPEIVKFEAIQQIPFPLDEVEWSYHLFEDPESPEVKVGIFAMKKELVAQHIKYFADVGLNVQAVQMNPLGVYNGLYHDEKLKGTTMIIDIGAENADLIIAEGEGVWMRSISIGGNAFTESLTKAFKLRFEKAEELKRTAATNKYGRRILQEMRPVFSDLVAEIQRSIGFYSSVHRDSRIAKVIALGGTFKLPGLQKYLQQNLQIEVQKLDSLGTQPPSDAKIAATLNENVLSVASAYGLALQALGQAKIGSSLLPQLIKREKEWKAKTKWFGAAAACVVVGVGLAGYSIMQEGSKFNSTEVDNDRKQANTTLADAQRLSKAWAQNEGQGASDRSQIRQVLSLALHRGVWNEILEKINNPFASNPYGLEAGKPPADPLKYIETFKKTPRAGRQYVLLDQMHSMYAPDLAPFLSMSNSEFAQQAQRFELLGVNELKARFAAGVRSPSGTGGTEMPFVSGSLPPIPSAGPALPPPPQPINPETGQPMEGAPAAAAKRGYVLTLYTLTPNSAGLSFVQQQVAAKLLAWEAAEHANLQRQVNEAAKDPTKQVKRRPFSIVRVVTESSQQVKINPDRAQALQNKAQAMSSRAQMGANGEGTLFDPRYYLQGLGAGGAVPIVPMPLTPGVVPGVMPGPENLQPGVLPPGLGTDPVTGESFLDDWHVVVMVAIVLDPELPAAPKKEGEESTEEGN